MSSSAGVSAVRVGEVLLSLLRRFEGLHKRVGALVHPYVCPAGYPTQGYGRVVKSMHAPPITPATAEQWLRDDAQAHQNLACRVSPALLTATDGQRAAIASFVYNLGITRYKASTLRRRVDARDWPAAAAELQKWVRGGGRVLPGLVARRRAEAQLMAG